MYLSRINLKGVQHPIRIYIHGQSSSSSRALVSCAGESTGRLPLAFLECSRLSIIVWIICGVSCVHSAEINCSLFSRGVGHSEYLCIVPDNPCSTDRFVLNIKTTLSIQPRTCSSDCVLQRNIVLLLTLAQAFYSMFRQSTGKRATWAGRTARQPSIELEVYHAGGPPYCNPCQCTLLTSAVHVCMWIRFDEGYALRATL